MRSSAPTHQKRYSIVGTGSRAAMFMKAITERFSERAILVAVCDSNPRRAQNWLREAGLDSVPSHEPADYGCMMQENRVETVIVSSMDRTHHRYICDATERFRHMGSGPLYLGRSQGAYDGRDLISGIAVSVDRDNPVKMNVKPALEQ